MATIKKLDKGSYEVRWDEYDAEGRRHQRRKHFDRANEANDFAKILDKDRPYEASTTKFDAWMDEWFETYKARVEATTAATYQCIVDRCKKHFGTVLLSKITPSAIEKFYDRLADPEHPLSQKALCSSSVQRHHALLHRAFSIAVRDGLMQSNPCDRVDRPISSRQEPEMPDLMEVQARLDALAGQSLYLPTVIALVTGMRQSEVLGLKWDAVDLKKGKIVVRRVRQRIGEERLKKIKLKASTHEVPGMPGWIERDYTKAKKNHTVPISPELVAVLKSAKTQQKKNQLLFGDVYMKTDYVSVYEDGRPMDANALANAMNGICRYHDLRHLNAVLLLRAGHSVATVADLLGHTTPQTTVTFYAHTLEEQKIAASKTMASAIKLKS